MYNKGVLKINENELIIREQIEHIKTFVEKNIKEIDNNKNYLHKNILLFTLFDRFTQDNVFMSKDKKNNVKFTTFIKNYSEWDKSEEYDPILLYYYLLEKEEKKEKEKGNKNKKENENENEKFMKDLLCELENALHEEGLLVEGFLPFPLYIEDINHTKFQGIINNYPEILKEISKFKYSNLLWKFRNKIVHEFEFPYHARFVEQDEKKQGINDFNYQQIKYHGDKFEFEDQVELILPYTKIKTIFIKSIYNYLEKCNEKCNEPIINKEYTHWYEKI